MALDQDEPQQEQSLVEHLTELRKRIVRSGIAVLIFVLIAWGFKTEIFEIVRAPIKPYLPDGKLIFTGPMDSFLAHLKVCLLASIIFSCPIWLYQMWKFIEPGLYEEERKYGLGFIFSGSVLFVSGVSFVYFVVYPMAFDFLLNFGGDIDQAMITIKEYLSFFFLTTLVFGAAFELPLILTILGIIGIIDDKFLREKRRYAIVILAILSALITPPDVISQVLLIVPLTILYEISILLVATFSRKRAAS